MLPVFFHSVFKDSRFGFGDAALPFFDENRRDVKANGGDDEQRRRDYERNPHFRRVAQTSEDRKTAETADSDAVPKRLSRLLFRVGPRLSDFRNRRAFGVFVEDVRRRSTFAVDANRRRRVDRSGAPIRRQVVERSDDEPAVAPLVSDPIFQFVRLRFVCFRAVRPVRSARPVHCSRLSPFRVKSNQVQEKRRPNRRPLPSLLYAKRSRDATVLRSFLAVNGGATPRIKERERFFFGRRDVRRRPGRRSGFRKENEIAERFLCGRFERDSASVAQVLSTPIERAENVEKHSPTFAFPFRKRQDLLNALFQRKRQPEKEREVGVVDQFFLNRSSTKSGSSP